jgi:hypothetical protein
VSTLPQGTLLTLAEYIQACLDETQRETRATLETPHCPPSGTGSEHDTVPAPYGVEGL